MEFWPVQFFDRHVNAASSFVRFYLSLKVKLRISTQKCVRFCIDLQFLLKCDKSFTMFSPLYHILCESQTALLFYFFVLHVLYLIYLSIYLSIYLFMDYIRAEFLKSQLIKPWWLWKRFLHDIFFHLDRFREKSW